MIRWLSARLVSIFHHELVVEHGGSKGIRDVGLLESAVARPRNLHAYEDADLCRLAAAFGFAIARDHPFVDGNKLTALIAMYVLLKINGVHLTASEEDAVHTILQLAAGKLTEKQLAEWIKQNSQ